jgi:hypothetical protein
MTLSNDPTNAFERFIAAFPEREGGKDPEQARQAWSRALHRETPETLIAAAAAYARAVEHRPRRYVMSARRWLNEGCWRDAAPVPAPSPPRPDSLVWIAYGTPAWDAWAAFYKATRGKTPPQDRRGGWRFASKWPPGH